MRLEDQFANPVAGVPITGQVIFGGVVFVSPQLQTSGSTVRVEITESNGEARFFVQVVSTVSEALVQMTAPQAAAPVQFLLNVTRILVGRSPRSVVVADVNHDGIPDLVTANKGSNDVSVLLGHGGGTFAPQQRFTVGADPVSVAVADLNHDGIPDLVTANQNSADVSVLVGHGNGTFAPQQRFTVGAGPASVAVADLNHDGIPDLVTANQKFADVSVLVGRGDGTFAPQQRFAVGVDVVPNFVAVADLNRDGIPDLVTANQNSADVTVLLGRGDGTFAAAQRFTIGVGVVPNFVAVADVNHDGIPDLVTTNAGSNEVSVLVGRGDGTFAAAQRFTVGAGPASVAVADVNHDGIPDLVTANGSSNDVAVLLGRGDGTFAAAQRFVVGVGERPVSVAVADVNHDGIPDLMTANGSSSDVAVLLGRGDGTFVAVQRFVVGVGERPVSVAVADVNHDGIPDLVTANTGPDFRSPSDVSVLLGRGDGTFAPQQRFPVGTNPQSVAVADLNHDGIPDLVTANAGSPAMWRCC